MPCTERTVIQMTDSFDSALYGVPDTLREKLRALPDKIKAQVFEIRLRSGLPVVLTTPCGNYYLTKEGGYTGIMTDAAVKTSADEVRRCFDLLCGYSVHTHSDELANGFISMNGGHRAGISGTAVMTGGQVTAFRNIFSINIRIARQVQGAASVVLANVFGMLGGIGSFLYFGPPGCGKTTYLRDTARQLSEKGYRTVIIDERGEIAASESGESRFDFSVNCDMICGCPKAKAVEMAVRNLNPHVVLFDEIGTDEEANAVLDSFHAGVKVVTTAHAGSLEELVRRRVTGTLIGTGIFKVAVFLPAVAEKEQFFVLEEESVEDSRDCSFVPVLGGHRIFKKYVS